MNSLLIFAVVAVLYVLTYFCAKSNYQSIWGPSDAYKDLATACPSDINKRQQQQQQQKYEEKTE